MAITDYGFFPIEGTGEIYLAKMTEDPYVMGPDRRLVTTHEITSIFLHYLRHFCEQHLGKTLTVMEKDKVVFQATLRDYEPNLNPDRPKQNGNDLCSTCGKELHALSLQSPMLQDNLWQQIMDFYALPQPDRNKGEHVFICAECMEKALGRELTLEDLTPVFWNQIYRLHRFYGVDFDTAFELRRIAKKYATESAPEISKDDYRRYLDFLTGVEAVFLNPKLSGLITAIKNLKENDQ